MFYGTMSLPKNIAKQGGYLALAHHNTIFAQIMKLIPRHEFEALAEKHHHGNRLRKIDRWSQFLALAMAQLTGRHSLRDLVANLNSQRRKLYHLGGRKVARSTLARVNEQQTWVLYRSLFEKLLVRCQSVAPKHKFRFKNKLYSLDASVINLCLNLFPWARFHQGKGAIKLHVGLDHDGHIPAFVAVTPGNIHEIHPARFMTLPKGSIVVFDRGYNDYTWYQELTTQGIFFVTRLKTNARYRVVSTSKVSLGRGVTADQVIRFTGPKAKQFPGHLRRIAYHDPVHDRDYVFLTNHHDLSAKTIADIYKDRWQIEIFFKCIKQNLKIKTFLGTSSNAVLTQVWVAMCVYLVLAFMKFMAGLGRSISCILRLLQINLFERRDLIKLLKPDECRLHQQNNAQLCLI